MVEDAAHGTDARNCAQRHRPVAFATEGLRLVLCFAFNCGIRAEIESHLEILIRCTDLLVEPLGTYG
jgi:hypothetical protein